MQDSLEPLQLPPFPMEDVPGEGETVVILTLIDNTDLTVNDARNPINGSCILCIHCRQIPNSYITTLLSVKCALIRMKPAE